MMVKILPPLARREAGSYLNKGIETRKRPGPLDGIERTGN